MNRLLILVLSLLALAGCNNAPAKLGTSLPSGNGQTDSAHSVSVVFASDSVGIAVNAPPDGGFATEGTLGAVKTDVDKIPSKGTAAMSGSTPVTIATDDTMTSKLTQPSSSAAVTKSDATALTCTKGLWVGTAGDLALKLASDSSAVTFKNVPSGTYVPGSVIRVMAATTAADVVCLQ